MSSAKLLNYKHINRDKYRYMPPVDSGEGYHQSECLYDYDQTGKNMIAHYIQTPRLLAATSIYMLENKHYLDVVVPYGSQFLEYLTSDDEKNILATSEHSGDADWFSSHYSVDDVVDQYVSPLVFRGNSDDPVMRLEVPSYQGKPLCEVFDVNQQLATTDLVKPGTEVIGVISKDGLRFFADRLTGTYTLHKLKVLTDKDQAKKQLPRGYLFDDEQEDQKDQEDQEDQENDDTSDDDDDEDVGAEDMGILTDEDVDLDISDDDDSDSEEEQDEDGEEIQDEDGEEVQDEDGEEVLYDDEGEEVHEEEGEEVHEEEGEEVHEEEGDELDKIQFTPELGENREELVIDDLTNINLDLDGGDDEEVEEEEINGTRHLMEPEDLTDDEVDLDVSDDDEDDDEGENVEEDEDEDEDDRSDNLGSEMMDLKDLDIDNDMELLSEDEDETLLLNDEPDYLDDSDLDDMSIQQDNQDEPEEDDLDFDLNIETMDDSVDVSARSSVNDISDLTNMDIEL